MLILISGGCIPYSDTNERNNSSITNDRFNYATFSCQKNHQLFYKYASCMFDNWRISMEKSQLEQRLHSYTRDSP